MRVAFSILATLCLVLGSYSVWAMTQVDWNGGGYLYWRPFGTGSFSWIMTVGLLVLSGAWYMWAFYYDRLDTSDECHTTSDDKPKGDAPAK